MAFSFFFNITRDEAVDAPRDGNSYYNLHAGRRGQVDASIDAVGRNVQDDCLNASKDLSLSLQSRSPQTCPLPWAGGVFEAAAGPVH